MTAFGPASQSADLVKTTAAVFYELVGVDFSQIYPGERGPVLWAYVQAVAYYKNQAPRL